MFPLIKSIKVINLNSKEERILALSSSLSLSFKDIYLKGKDNKIILELLSLVLELLLIYIKVNRLFLTLNIRSSSKIARLIDILRGANSIISLAIIVLNSVYL